jgi:wobble nucleotide-excising tRNase
MLKKFAVIKNVGTFRNSPALGEEMRKLTLVHAENGRGKTTLCAIMRSLKNGDGIPIVERKSLDSDGAPQVKVMLDVGLRKFNDGKWCQKVDDFEIFDAAFVANNVYSGDDVTHDHKKNLCRVVIGAEGVKLAERYDELDAEVKKLAGEEATLKAAVQALAPKGMTAEKYMELPVDPEIDKKITAKKAELAALADAEAIRIRKPVTAVEVPQPPSNLSATLQKTIEGVSKDAEQRIRAHIAKHKMGEQGEAWLADGVEYASDDECAYCAQSLKHSSIVSDYAAFFGEAYRNFQAELVRRKGEFDTSLSDATLMSVQQAVSGNAVFVEFWKKHVIAEAPSMDFAAEFKPVIVALLEALKPLVAQKVASPLEAVAYSEDVLAKIEDWKALRSVMATYNEQLKAYNEAIKTLKAAPATANIAVVRQQIEALEAEKTRHEKKGLEAVRDYKLALIKKLAEEIEKTKAKDALDVYNEKIIGKYGKTVNGLLKRFGTSFTLETVRVQYTGRTPRIGYSIGLRGKEIELGGDKTPQGTSSFSNTLSSGDRSALALALFIAQLKNRADLSNLIVVFDDPFTSLDSFRQNYMCEMIRSIARDAKQVIVLSHSLEFLKLVATRCDKSATVAMKIDMHRKTDSRIIVLNLNDATAELIDKDCCTIA